MYMRHRAVVMATATLGVIRRLDNTAAKARPVLGGESAREQSAVAN